MVTFHLNSERDLSLVARDLDAAAAQSDDIFADKQACCNPLTSYLILTDISLRVQDCRKGLHYLFSVMRFKAHVYDLGFVSNFNLKLLSHVVIRDSDSNLSYIWYLC